MKEINDLIENSHVAHRGCFENVLCFIKKIVKRLTHTTLFDVSTGSWKNISDGLNFVTQTWRWPTNVMTQTPFTDGVDLRVKGIKKPNYYKNHFSLTKEKGALLETSLDVSI